MIHRVTIKGVTFETCKCLIENHGKLVAKDLKIAKCALKAKDPYLIEGKVYPRINYGNCDETTRSIIDNIRAQKESVNIKGLINFDLGRMRLGEERNHMALAKHLGLLKDEIHLMDGWYGFNLDCENLLGDTLLITPSSGVFLGIPIKYSPVFESQMNGLFGKNVHGRTIDIFFFQLTYKRILPLEMTLFFEGSRELGLTMVQRSLSDAQLKRLYPGK